MWNLLGLLKRNLTISIPAFMTLGIAYGAWFDPAPLKVLIVPLTVLMVYPMMVTIDPAKLLARGGWKLQGTTQLINFIAMPLVGWAIGSLFFADRPYLMVGLLLTSLLPTSGMTISWTGFSEGNVPAAIRMTVIGLVWGVSLRPCA